MSQSPKPLEIGLLLFPGLTPLDLTGPFEVFARLPDTLVHLVAKSLEPVRTDRGLVLMPSVTLANCPPLDVVAVPGGPGQQKLMEDEAVLDFLRVQAESAQYVTSVCTGALVLGAAGLLRGYKATTHWLSLPLLPLFGAEPVAARIVVDRNRVTGGGVTAGIDFGLKLAALLRGEAVAQQIQLQIEYDPEPPFRSGSPKTAPAEIVAAARQAGAPLQAERRSVCERIAQAHR
jgi:cyclohexyl-isocyanide hydratase